MKTMLNSLDHLINRSLCWLSLFYLKFCGENGFFATNCSLECYNHVTARQTYSMDSYCLNHCAMDFLNRDTPNNINAVSARTLNKQHIFVFKQIMYNTMYIIMYLLYIKS